VNPTQPSPEIDELATLRARLTEADETLRAIGSGEVDALVGTGEANAQVFTLSSAGDAYRVLIESMNEGALTLTTDKTILYANACFAKMVRRPLEQVIGVSFREFLAAEDREPLHALLKSAGKDGSKVQLILHLDDGSQLPVLISVRPLARNSSDIMTVGVVVTDMTESRRNEEMLRGFSQRLVQGQEAEREHVATQLHDHITQLLCAIVLRSTTLAEKLSPDDKATKKEVGKLREMLGDAANEVTRISRHLRPSVLDHLGLSAVLDMDCTEFQARTGIRIELHGEQLSTRLPADAELAFYRILQEALRNVGHHARAKKVIIHLNQVGAFVEMSIQDDGIGFDPEKPGAKPGYGLHSMRERAAAVGGSLSVESSPGHGTAIHAKTPFVR